MDANSLPKTVTRHGCNLNPGPSVPASSRQTTWLLSPIDMNVSQQNSVIVIVTNIQSEMAKAFNSTFNIHKHLLI